MYRRILVALDGSPASDLAIDAAVALSKYATDVDLIGCHVYTSQPHPNRGGQTDPELPEKSQKESRCQNHQELRERLMTDETRLISDPYMAPLARVAAAQHVRCSGLTLEGRDDLVLLEVIAQMKPDLVVMGAVGQGVVSESNLGSLTEAVLQSALCDVLVLRKAWQFNGRPIIVGVDGSDDSYTALMGGMQISKAFGASLEAVAVHNSAYQTEAFNELAEKFSQKDQKGIDRPDHKKLHDDMAERDPEKSYRQGLERAGLIADRVGVSLPTELLTGKVSPQIHSYAGSRDAGLLVMGRWGLHRQAESLIGSNTAHLARITQTNLLVTAPSSVAFNLPPLPEKFEEKPPVGSHEAEEKLKRIPFFMRGIVKKAIKEWSRENDDR